MLVGTFLGIFFVPLFFVGINRIFKKDKTKPEESAG